MKKDTTTIKRILRQTDNTNLYGFFQNEDDFVISNGYSVILSDVNSNGDFITDLENLNNAGHYDFKLFADFINKNIEERNKNGSETIEILVDDLKMWKKHGEKRKPFIIPTKKGLMGVNPSYLLDLATLTRQDKNNTLIKIKVIDKKAPLYIDGNGVKALLCPVMVTDCTEKTYDNFKNKLADCYDLEKNTQELKALEKANKPERNKKTKVSNMPIIIKNGVVCKDGYIYSDRNVDFLIYKNADNKTYTLYHLNSMLPCFTDCKSITAAIELIYDKLGEKPFIEKVIDIMQGNGAQERYNILIKAFGCLESATHFIDKLIDFEPTPTPNNDTTKEETPKTATIQDNAADIVADPDANETKTSDIVKADTVKADTCTDTTDNMSATATDTATNDRKKALHGFYMTFKNRDIFVATNEDTKRRYVVQAFISEMINISNHLQNITEEKRNNILNDEDVLNETKKRITPATIEEIWTSQENHIRITADNGNTIISQSLNDFKTIMIDKIDGNAGMHPMDGIAFKFFDGISRLNNQLTETITQDIKADLQADNRQTETTQDTTNNAITSETMQADARQDTTPTQDKPHKTSTPTVSLFVVTDKPQPVKLYGANIPTLERIPTYTQRIISRLQPLKSHRVYNTRVSNKKSLKKAYNDFVGTVSMSCDKCAIGGGLVAVNSS